MPITKSAKKSLRVAKRRTKENRLQKNALEKALKTASPKTLPKVISLIDKAAKTGIIHKNKAGRLKSRLTTRLALGVHLGSTESRREPRREKFGSSAKETKIAQTAEGEPKTAKKSEKRK